MLSNNYLISFLGGTDLKNADDFIDNPSALIQVINFVKPKNIYLFITSEMVKDYEKSNLKKNIISLFPKINIIVRDKKEITNPTDTKQIYESIYPDLKEISQIIIKEKTQGFVNLTSGTPQIISVLTLSLITNILQRSHGVYAPNPKFDKGTKVDPLEFFKNSIGFESLKRLIDKYNYSGISSLMKEMYFESKMNADPEIALIVDFAKYRFNSNFDKAFEIYKKSDVLKKSFNDYEIGDSLDDCLERYYTLNPLRLNENDAQSIIWLATIKETLSGYVVKQLYKENFSLITVDNKEKDGPQYFNKEQMDSIYPDLKKHIQECWEKEPVFVSTGKPFCFDSYIKQHAYKYLLNYAIVKEFAEFHIPTLKKLESCLNALEDCYSIRNKVAHNITSKDLNPDWIKKAGNAVKYSYKIFKNKDISLNNPYDEINEILKDRIEKLFS